LHYEDSNLKAANLFDCNTRDECVNFGGPSHREGSLLSTRRAKITAVSHYLPERRVTNKDLEKVVDTSDEWIVERTGIHERRVAAKGQATSDLGAAAAKRLLEKRGIAAAELDLIIVATVTPDMFFPSSACLIQNKIGAKHAWGFDLSGACSGFLYALTTGAQFIAAGSHKKVLVIGADVMTSILDFKDRATCVLFGDGAGAVLLEPAEEGEQGIIDFLLRSDGSGGQFLYMPGGGSLNPTSAETIKNNMHCVHQDGRNVFKFAVRGMAEISHAMLTRHGLSPKDLKLYIPHQANLRIINAAVEKLGLAPAQVAINIDRYANTTAGTIPICLSEADESKTLNNKDLILLASFGAGFTWGSLLLRWEI
jgi:3-oxoacyl-[acyl-carrier-protein] synthase-3